MNELLKLSARNSIYIETRYKETLEKITVLFKSHLHPEWKLVNNPIDCDMALYFDLADSDSMNIVNKSAVTKVLVRQEPKLVIPENYDANLIKIFDHVIDIGKSKEDAFLNINWPQDLSHIYINGNKRKNRFVMVNSNLLSLTRDQNYSLRREIAAKIHSVDLFGFKWNNSSFEKFLTLVKELKKYLPRIYRIELSGLKYYFKTFDNYLGAVVNKREAMSAYKYSIVIENTSNYVSEKLFDSLLSGCIPIYVGPDLSLYDLPENLYLQAEPNFADIKSKMTHAQEQNYEEWAENVKVWLEQANTKENWSQEFFFKKILTAIKKIH
jgi:hypothetical protein